MRMLNFRCMGEQLIDIGIDGGERLPIPQEPIRSEMMGFLSAVRKTDDGVVEGVAHLFFAEDVDGDAGVIDSEGNRLIVPDWRNAAAIRSLREEQKVFEANSGWMDQAGNIVPRSR